MVRRLVAFLLGVWFPGAAFLYAGWPILAPVGLLVWAVVLVAPLGYVAGVLAPSSMLPCLVLLGVAAIGGPPIVAALLPPRDRPDWQRPWLYLLAEAAQYPLPAAVVLATRTWVVEPSTAESDSMAPGVVRGDIVLVRKGRWAEPVAPGAVIAFRHPDRRVVYLKRVVAVAGQEVSLVDGVPWVDGVGVPVAALGEAEPSLGGDCRPGPGNLVFEERLGGHTYQTWRSLEVLSRVADTPPMVVPAGHLFVVGDNRDASEDSRFFGAVPVGDVVGVVHDRVFSRDPCTGLERPDRAGPVP